ncbi:MAG: hypothetical protein ACOYBY_19080, partial [Dermatophilaceae bacterium]
MTTATSSDQSAGPLTIAAQGSFAVGGAVVTREGTFDPRNPMDPAGQSLHGDHARIVTIQVAGADSGCHGLPVM